MTTAGQIDICGVKRPSAWPEAVIASLLSLALVLYHVRFFLHGGALWRDEVSTLTIAIEGSLPELWANLHHDSFPILWHLILRAWFYSGIGSTDRGMRELGLLVGLLIIAALWFNARRFGAIAPIASLTLLGFANANLCYVDSLRAYGIGMLTGLIALGGIWQLCRDVRARTVVFGLVASFLAVNALYYNSVLILAGTCGAVSVCIANKNLRRAALVLAINGFCGCWMIVYHNVIHGRNLMAPVFRAVTTYARVMWKQHESIMAMPVDGRWLVRPDVIWGIGLAIGIAVASRAVYRLFKTTAGQYEAAPSTHRDLIIFATVTLVVGLPTYWTFLVVLRYVMQPWYFLALMALVATCLEGIFAATLNVRGRIILVLAAALVAALNGYNAWNTAGVRMTNVDYTTQWLDANAKPGDVIIVSPWWIGMSFGRYYKGPAAWTMIPRIAQWDFQRTDLYQVAVKDPHCADDVLDQMTTALKSGHHAWIVSLGTTWFGRQPRSQPPTYPTGDPDMPYLLYWEDQLSRALWEHATVKGPLVIRYPDQPVIDYEVTGIFAASGWDARQGARKQMHAP